MVRSRTNTREPKVQKCLNEQLPLTPVKISLEVKPDEFGVLFKISTI